MKKFFLNHRTPEGPKALPAMGYLLLIALIVFITGSSEKVIQLPAALISIALFIGVARRKLLHIRRGGYYEELSTV